MYLSSSDLYPCLLLRAISGSSDNSKISACSCPTTYTSASLFCPTDGRILNSPILLFAKRDIKLSGKSLGLSFRPLVVLYVPIQPSIFTVYSCSSPLLSFNVAEISFVGRDIINSFFLSGYMEGTKFERSLNLSPRVIIEHRSSMIFFIEIAYLYVLSSYCNVDFEVVTNQRKYFS